MNGKIKLVAPLAVLLLSALALAQVPPAATGPPPDQTEQSMRRLGSIEKELNQKAVEKAAKQGDAEAQFNLGAMYFTGQDVKQDYKKAAKWYRKAAEQEHVGAQCNLALMYRDAQGVKQDYKEAVKWYRKAADQGDAEGEHMLGVMYDTGQGVTQDYQQAAEWFRKASGQGYPQAQYNLGIMYYTGQGVPQDLVQAHMWIHLAASKFSEKEREPAVKARDVVASRMTPEQIAEAQTLAGEWKP
jgi:TPR repeat protein